MSDDFYTDTAKLNKLSKSVDGLDRRVEKVEELTSGLAPAVAKQVEEIKKPLEGLDSKLADANRRIAKLDVSNAELKTVLVWSKWVVGGAAALLLLAITNLFYSIGSLQRDISTVRGSQEVLSKFAASIQKEADPKLRVLFTATDPLPLPAENLATGQNPIDDSEKWYCGINVFVTGVKKPVQYYYVMLLDSKEDYSKLESLVSHYSPARVDSEVSNLESLDGFQEDYLFVLDTWGDTMFEYLQQVSSSEIMVRDFEVADSAISSIVRKLPVLARNDVGPLAYDRYEPKRSYSAYPPTPKPTIPQYIKETQEDGTVIKRPVQPTRLETKDDFDLEQPVLPPWPIYEAEEDKKSDK